MQKSHFGKFGKGVLVFCTVQICNFSVSEYRRTIRITCLVYLSYRHDKKQTFPRACASTVLRVDKKYFAIEGLERTAFGCHEMA